MSHEPEGEFDRGLRQYKPFSGRMRYDHAEGLGGLSRVDRLLWLLNAVCIVLAVLIAVLFGLKIAAIIFFALVAVEGVALYLFRRSSRSRSSQD